MSTWAINHQDGGKTLWGSAWKAEKNIPSSWAWPQGAIADDIKWLLLDPGLNKANIKINLEKLQEVADKLLKNPQILQQLQSVQDNEIEAMIRAMYVSLSQNHISINWVKITDKRVANIFLDDQAREQKIRKIITNYNEKYEKNRNDETITQLTDNAMQAHRIPCVPFFVSDAIKQQKKDILFTEMNTNMEDVEKLFELLYGKCLLWWDNGGDEIMVPLQKVRKYVAILCVIMFLFSAWEWFKMGSKNPDPYTVKLKMIEMEMEQEWLKLPEKSMLMLQQMIEMGLLTEKDIEEIIKQEIDNSQVNRIYKEKQKAAAKEAPAKKGPKQTKSWQDKKK
jgi:hypothetical protein